MEEQIWHKYKWPETVKKTLEPYPNEPLHKILENTANSTWYTASVSLSKLLN